MEFILPLILAVILAPLGVVVAGFFALIGILILKVLSLFAGFQRYKLVFQLAIVLGSLAIIAGFPIIIFFLPNTMYEIACHRAQVEREMRAKAFWDWFSTIDKTLYSATTDDDPAVVSLKKKLISIGPSMSFKLGPTHQGKRELAFVGSGTISSTDLVDEGVGRNLSRWFIGEGFKRPLPDPSISLEYGLHGSQKRLSAYDADFLFEVQKRNGDLELVIYTSKPWEIRAGYGVFPVDYFLEEALGEYVYGEGLGKVQIKKMSELPPAAVANVVSIKELYSKCENLLPQNKRAFIEKIVVDRPCVLRSSERPSSFEKLLGIRQGLSNPYMPKRRLGGLAGLISEPAPSRQ